MPRSAEPRGPEGSEAAEGTHGMLLGAALAGGMRAVGAHRRWQCAAVVKSPRMRSIMRTCSRCGAVQCSAAPPHRPAFARQRTSESCDATRHATRRIHWSRGDCGTTRYPPPTTTTQHRRSRACTHPRAPTAAVRSRVRAEGSTGLGARSRAKRRIRAGRCAGGGMRALAYEGGCVVARGMRGLRAAAVPERGRPSRTSCASSSA